MLRALTAPARFLRRRPDLWAGVSALAIAVAVFWSTPLRVFTLDRVLLSHLADSFGAGLISVIVGLFVLLLLRAAPPATARTLGAGWAGIVAVSTLGLLFSFASPTHTSTSWILQSLVLSVLVWSALLAVLLPAAGLVRTRDFLRAAQEIGRHWIGVLFYLGCGGYVLTIVRVYSPDVFDPLLFKMDASLGVPVGPAIAVWTAAHPIVRAVSDHAYPLLGFFIAAVGARLHRQGRIVELRRYLNAIVFVAFLGPVCYWVAPGVGPVYAFPALYGSGAAPAGLAARILHGPAMLTFDLSVMRNVMPSLHTAFTLVAFAAVWPRRREFLRWLPLGFMQIATTLTLGVHYVVDLLAAVPLAVLCWSLAEAAVRRFPPTGAAPLPPLSDLDRGVRRLAGGLAASLAALAVWAFAAPVSPLLAWPLALLIVAAPAAAAIRLFRRSRAAAAGVSARPDLRSSNSDLRAASAPRLLACAVFCTGGTALILEQVAEKYLTTLLGASRPAATLVLVVYFAGLALGAALCPTRTAGAARRLAVLELFIAGWCALLALGFFALDRPLGEWLAAHDSSAFALASARTALAVLWLLPPTLAMGAQLPTLAAVLRGLGPETARALPRYYTLNLAGAFAFTIGAPPLLFNLVGANGALWFAAALGAFVGLILWSGLPSPPSIARLPSGISANHDATRRGWPVLAAAFAAGFVFFALEVLWFHLISAVSGASTYSFSSLLAAILLGLALAGWRIARHSPPPLVGTLVVLAPVLVVSNALWPWAGRVMAAAAGLLRLQNFWAGELLKFVAIAAIVVPPAFLLGQIFPRLLRQAGDDSTLVGRLSAANVLGCIAGALVTGTGFIPTFGAEHTLLGFATLAAMGAILGVPWAHRFQLRAFALASTSLCLLVALPHWNRLELTRGYGVYLTSQFPPGTQLLSFREDDRSGFVTVTTTPVDGRATPAKTLLQNGKFDADDAGEQPAQIAFGLLAALHAPTQQRALVIGAGSGQTASIVARLGFAHLDIAELSPAHLAAAREQFSQLNARVFDLPGVAVHVEDGRNFLLRTRDRYDVIQIELTSVWFAGATNLYSREFYALARSRLAPGGALVQWIQLHHLTAREIATILATARAAFPVVSVWRAGGQACLIASDRPPQLNREVWLAWLSEPTLAHERLVTSLTTADTVAACELLPAPALDRLLARHAGAYGINTDANRWLEFQTPKYYLDRRDLRTANLRWLGEVR